jgi:hypothetical protein
MPDWIVNYWIKNSDALIVTVAGGLILAVLVAIPFRKIWHLWSTNQFMEKAKLRLREVEIKEAELRLKDPAICKFCDQRMKPTPDAGWYVDETCEKNEEVIWIVCGCPKNRKIKGQIPVIK